ncbi:MAG TPA: glycosyltransferase [Syntrophales bacterium]|nr:glycosyltransferase [Syntrophales bacterium]
MTVIEIPKTFEEIPRSFMDKNVNLVFLGLFPYPHGMAGTKRIQHAIDAFKADFKVMIHVIILYQSSKQNILKGEYEGTVYETMLGDLYGMKKAIFLPLLYIRTIRALKRSWRRDCKNILYNYGSITVDNFIALLYAKHLGYKIVLDIVEDYDAAKSISVTFLNRLNVAFISWLEAKAKDVASGIIVISRHLERKYANLVQGSLPIHYRPISVDMKRFRLVNNAKKNGVSLLYAGTFGKKDGILVLLDAFNKLAAKRKNVRLTLSGRGTAEEMRAFFSRMELSPYKDRIDYRGYIDEEEYYFLLSSIDVACMTRIELAYAHAGFPFKLGEFLASGKPVIASRVSDVESFLADRQNAMLVRPGSSDEIVEAAEYLIDQPEAARKIGEEGRKVAGSVFDYRAQGEALLSFLKSL